LGDVKRIGDLSVNWVSQHLYWTDTVAGRIMMSHLNGTGRLTVVKDHLQSPMAIKVDPESGSVD